MTAQRIRTNATPPQREESPESRRLFGAGLGRAAPTYSRRKALQGQCDCAKTHKRRAADSVLRRDRRQKARKPEVNPPSSITTPTIRERTIGDHDPRRNRNATSRKPSCLAHRRQTAGVNRGQTPRQNRKAGRAPSKPPRQNRRYGRTPSANAPNKTARTGAHQAQMPRQSRRSRHAERRTSRQPESTCRGVSEFRISPAVPPRAQTPVPAL